jgi:hypothetical protein
MAYAEIAELAAALRIQVTSANSEQLQTCLDAAAIEIDDALDRTEVLETGQLPLANRVNILRGVEWYKANDAAFGVLGVSDTGTLTAPRNTMRRHAIALLPLKQQFGLS